MALLALPLVQLLRFQGLEVAWAMAERDRVEPALLAVNLQRGLVDHRLASRQVLSGQQQAEATRREHQAAVDARLAMLGYRLEQGTHPPALLEIRDMRLDWLALVQQVVARRCSVPESELAHSLLIEQTLQIIDSVSAAAPQPQDARLAALLGPLPRALAQTLAQTSLPSRAVAPASTAQAQAQAQAEAQAQAQAKAQAKALSATMARLQVEVQQTQARRIAWHQGQRALAGAGLLTLALGLVGTLAWLRRSLAVRPPSAVGTTDSGPATWQPPPADGQQAALLARQGLLQRLRGPQPQAARPPLGEPTQPQDL